MDGPRIDLVSIFDSPSRKRCSEYALVLQAVGIRCEVLPRDSQFALVVDAQDSERGLQQIALYLRENRARPIRFDSRFAVTDGLVCACLFGLTILLFDILQREQAFSLNWLRAGVSQAGLIQSGEWWRAVTALSLHADSVHLAGNLVFGLVMGFLAGELLGWGLAWGGMLFAGALGNTINAFIQSPAHTSIGASTAVFAALGILTAYTWKRRRRHVGRWAPLAGGIALLAFLGMEGERTDIFAHVAGFGSGCLFGLAIGALESRARFEAWHKHALGIAATLFLVFAWTLAHLA